MLRFHVERPEQLGASVSPRLDLLPGAGTGEKWKRVRRRKGGNEIRETYEEVLGKVIAREPVRVGNCCRAQSCWQE